jgi:hypothetical protein
MLRHSLFTALVLTATACGMGAPDEGAAQTGTQQDPLYRDQLERAPLTDLAVQRTERCFDEVIQPTLKATIREMVQLRTRDVLTDVGAVVQSSYLNTTGENEELRKGIAEFQVSGDVSKAVLQFQEARTVWPYPVAADTHGISIYPADFKATVEDFDDPAQEVIRFETDVNLPPRDAVAGDVTLAVQRRQPAVGFRFELEATPGIGTQFDNVQLVVTRCHHSIEELR